MKVRDSGMPDELLWNSFFDVNSILDKMGIDKIVNNLMEIGCGYGTFTVEAAKRISGTFYAFDIEQEMIDDAREKSKGITNIKFIHRDIISEGSSLPQSSIDYVMLFNILHHDKPGELLGEVSKVLKNKGKAGIIHWRSDIKTPRGPELAFRPKPEQCVEWAVEAGFRIERSPFILEPYHYGLIIQKS